MFASLADLVYLLCFFASALCAGLLVRQYAKTRIPVLLGDGIPLFGRLRHDIRLKHVGTRAFPSGMVQSEYIIAT